MAWVLGKRLQLDSSPCGETRTQKAAKQLRTAEEVMLSLWLDLVAPQGRLDDEITADEILLSCPGKQSSAPVLFSSPLA